jgi:hypothetical protein
MNGGERDGESPPAAAEPLALIVFALLVLACFAAFFVTQRLKHTPTVVHSFEMTPSFTPTASGAAAQEAISFKLARAEEVTVAIVDANEQVVATLVRDRPVRRYKQFSLRWNGRVGTARGYRQIYSAHGRAILVPEIEGALAPIGEYRVRLSLREQGHSVLLPRSFKLVGR